MVDRAQLEATLNERGVAFDHYATDDALELLVEQSAHSVYDPAPPTVDRSRSEAFLDGRAIVYDPGASDAELAAQVLAIRDADHERYLSRYQPVITRLPAAVGTSPEQPEQDDIQDEAAPPVGDAPHPEVGDVGGVAGPPTVSGDETGQGQPVEGAPIADATTDGPE